MPSRKFLRRLVLFYTRARVLLLGIALKRYYSITWQQFWCFISVITRQQIYGTGLYEVNSMFRKLTGILVFFLVVLTSVSLSIGCVGRVLYVGALPSATDRLMSELLVMLINERTGTNVQIRFFDDRDQLYEAMKLTDEAERVDIIVEDTSHAMNLLKQERLSDADQEYLMAKELYDKEFDIIWLNPFGFQKKQTVAEPAVSAPLLRRDVLTNFPLLPRILNKLAGTIDDETFNDLAIRVSTGDKPKNVAKDFLRTKKLI